MKQICLALLVLIVLISGMFAGDSSETHSLQARDQVLGQKISGLLSAQIEAKKQIKSLGGLAAAQASQSADGVAGILQSAGLQVESVDRQKIFLYSSRMPDAAQVAELEALGVIVYLDSWIPPVGAHPDGFLIADMPVDRLSDISAKSYVRHLDTAERVFQAQNDEAALATNVAALRGGSYGLDGTGVTIAVLDSGLDLSHPDIPSLASGTIVKDYSNWPSLDETVANHYTGHGTHVTGSVLGDGSASSGLYAGMAPGADLVFLKIGNDSNASATSEAMVNAIQDAVDVYHADIITMSYGGWSDHHDGSDAMSQAVDYAVSQGAVVLIAAGNSGNDADHYSGTVPGNDSTDFIAITAGNTPASLYFNMVWFDGPGISDDLELEYYNSSRHLIGSTQFLQNESFRGTESQYSNVASQPAGTYYLKVKNNSSSAQLFHLYYVGNGYVTFADPDPAYTLNSPAEADSAIAIGAYVTRASWLDYSGAGHSYGYELDEIAPFSSRGPRVDTGAPLKPEIVAPGSVVISARDGDIYTSASLYWIDNSEYYVMQGTSMATPVAAGAAALIIQVHPDWTPAQVRDYLESNAVDMGAAGNDDTHGHGRLYLPETLAEPDANDAPVLAAIGAKSGDELVEITFTATAADVDVPTDTLIFSLDDGAPAGAAITEDGVFTWTPAEDQGPGVYPVTIRVTDNGTPALDDFETFDITVAEVNIAPVLAEIGAQSVDELVEITFTAAAVDADVPADTLTFSLDGGAPAGAVMTEGGVFTWTPTEAQGGAVYTFDVVVSDGGLSDSETITVTVNEVNVAPVLAEIGAISGDELVEITFTATAADADLPADILTFSLADGAGGSIPAGASITADGVFTWTPTEAQGGAVYTFDVVVSDGSLSDSETITVTVPAETSTLELIAGWNFIGLPVIPVSTDISDVLAGIIDKVVIVWSYDGAAWTRYIPGVASSLTQMTSGVGYWINLSEAATLTVSGTIPPSNDITLTAGWNLISLGTAPGDPDIGTVLAGIIDDVVIVWHYDGVTGIWTRFIPGSPATLTEMTQGNAYWVYMSSPRTLTIT
ncbi:S8 family serine peptidase [Dehalogenimonas sp. THU2]|uniref:S8 family serine peptidase n=1 Tax=Dehalogenimonas sp. THU2 TaxID=3151121 RepID=UPI0032186AA7